LKNKVGVIQGRLLPKYKGRYQAHPLGYWQEEFAIARELNLDCIEFILDYNDANLNPLTSRDGIFEIKSKINKTGVNINTICADYFMEAPLHSENPDIAKVSQEMLELLLKNSKQLGVKDIVIPCVDQSSLGNLHAQECFVEKLMPFIGLAEDSDVKFSLETDLAPKEFLSLIEYFNSSQVKVNYDIGNSASLGYNPVEELDTYGHMISDIHIKDRFKMGGSTLLGTGDADFHAFFNKLKDFDYKGPFIMQAYRDDNGIEVFKKQLKWFFNLIDELNY
jgi:L-ribulose-5-phosphate 3-epimerase